MALFSWSLVTATVDRFIHALHSPYIPANMQLNKLLGRQSKIPSFHENSNCLFEVPADSCNLHRIAHTKLRSMPTSIRPSIPKTDSPVQSTAPPTPHTHPPLH